MNSTVEGKPHAVCVPFPTQGHINAMLQVAKLLHSKGFHITFVHTDFNYDRIVSSGGPSSLDGLPDFQFEAIPDGLPRSGPVQCVVDHAQAVRTNLAEPFRRLLARLEEPSAGAPPVSCVVSDCVTSFTLEASSERGIPNVFFNAVSAASSMAAFQFKELMERGFIPLKSESDLTNGYLETPVDFIPGMKNIRLRDITTFIRTTNPDDITFNLLKDAMQASPQATAHIFNTFVDLEHRVLDAMSAIYPQMYTIGPLSQLYRSIPDGPLKSLGSSLWKDDSGCLQWLEGRAPRSVVYVNFGSVTTITSQQMLEFAWGLANSGYNFLWVIRPDLVRGESAVLPEEFLTESGGRSFLASWCPQEEVLSHPAVGGFLTHGGWNSVMESITGGVPMICWPFFADQPMNCRYLCSEWGIGMEIENDVKREEVERLIRELMGGEKGEEMRRKVLKWKESAVRATEPGGSSSLNLDRVIKEVLLGRK